MNWQQSDRLTPGVAASLPTEVEFRLSRIRSIGFRLPVQGLLPCLLGCLLLGCSAGGFAAADSGFSESTGRQLMEAVFERHQQYPYVYEEQTMVLVDRYGNRETRRLKRYSRIESSKLARLMLLFVSPNDVNGVAVLAQRTGDGLTEQAVYLPALGNRMVRNEGVGLDVNFLGSDFSVESLTGENLEDYTYSRQRDVYIEEASYFIVDVFPGDGAPGYPLHRHYISQDNLYITRTDYFDDLGRLRKRQSQHDLIPVMGDMWRANMVLMQDFQEDHRTLIKVDRRVFSADYVPEGMFLPEWLYSNYAQQSAFETPAEATVDAEAEAKLTEGAGS